MQFSKSKFHVPRKKIFWLDDEQTYQISIVIVVLILLLIMFILSTLFLSIYHLIFQNKLGYESVTELAIKPKSKYRQINDGKRIDFNSKRIEENQMKMFQTNASGKKCKDQTECLKLNLNDLIKLSPKKFVPQN